MKQADWVKLAMGLVLVSFLVFFLGYAAGLKSLASPYYVTVQYAPEQDEAIPEATKADGYPKSLLPGERININTAPVEDLMRLPNIGKTRAEAIVQRRENYGPFTQVEQLLEISGIGETILEKIKDYVTVE